MITCREVGTMTSICRSVSVPPGVVLRRIAGTPGDGSAARRAASYASGDHRGLPLAVVGTGRPGRDNLAVAPPAT